MTAPLRTAMVGCGAIAHWHLDAIDRAGVPIAVTAAIDPDDAQARRVADRTGGASHPSLAAALATVYLAAFFCLAFVTYSMALLGEYAALALGTVAYALFAVAALASGNVVVLIAAAALACSPRPTCRAPSTRWPFSANRCAL